MHHVQQNHPEACSQVPPLETLTQLFRGGPGICMFTSATHLPQNMAVSPETPAYSLSLPPLQATPGLRKGVIIMLCQTQYYMQTVTLHLSHPTSTFNEICLWVKDPVSSPL